MLRYTCFNGRLELRTPGYTAKRDRGKPFFYIRTSGVANVLDLKLNVALDERILELQDAEALYDNGHHTADALRLNFGAAEGAVLHLNFFADRIEASVSKIHNAGIVRLFAGSRLNCDVVFNPYTGTLPEHYYDLREPQHTRPDCFSPPPWFFAYRQKNEKWASTALEPDAGELDFLDLETAPESDGTMAWLVNMGVVPENATAGRHTPPVVFRFDAENEFAALQSHADHVAAAGKITLPHRKVEPWQTGILACGWRFQSEAPRPEKCTQKNYQAFADMLDENKIAFDTLIVDDFWGKQHGWWQVDPDKWPDMRKFIDQLHARGKHLLLWISTDPTGLPAEECVGFSTNPNSEAYKKRLAQTMHELLSADPGCLNADGFKYDFTAQLPTEYPPGSLRNMAFMYERFRLITAAAKAVKPDCLLDYQCANPYFAHLQDMLRINDYFGLPETAMEEMVIRCRIAQIVSYGALIDTDHNSYEKYPYDHGENYFSDIRAYGCPSLYLMPEDLTNPKLLQTLQQLKSCPNGKF